MRWSASETMLRPKCRRAASGQPKCPAVCSSVLRWRFVPDRQRLPHRPARHALLPLHPSLPQCFRRSTPYPFSFENEIRPVAEWLLSNVPHMRLATCLARFPHILGERGGLLGWAAAAREKGVGRGMPRCSPVDTASPPLPCPLPCLARPAVGTPLSRAEANLAAIRARLPLTERQLAAALGRQPFLLRAVSERRCQWAGALAAAPPCSHCDK